MQGEGRGEKVGRRENKEMEGGDHLVRKSLENREHSFSCEFPHRHREEGFFTTEVLFPEELRGQF